MIPEQIRLPSKVALRVVIQGFRIRFGRSVVTVLGVVLGIAFLMAMLTGQVLKRSLAEEDRHRLEANRMFNYLTTEIGPIEGRTLGLVVTGSLNEFEKRLLRRLKDEKLKHLNWTPSGENSDIEGSYRGEYSQVSADKVAAGASALLIMGATPPPDEDWDSVMREARQKVIALSRDEHFTSGEMHPSMVNLGRKLRDDEIERLKKDKERARSRTIWIITIALLVTLMGITNSLLMSVTERFREIGTMKCLGALSAFVRLLFLIETTVIGVAGGVLGCIAGLLFTYIIYAFTYGFNLTTSAFLAGGPTLFIFGLVSLIGGIVMSILAGIYPAHFASRMVPAAALRTNI